MTRSSSQEQLQKAKREAAKAFLKAPTVIAVGIGKKLKKGAETTIDSVRIYVSRKCDRDQLPAAFKIPKSILDVPTDVIPIGRPFRPITAPSMRRSGGRRVKLGASIGFALPSHSPKAPGVAQHGGAADELPANVSPVVSGRLGAIVEDAEGEKYVLSNNHVLAMNGRVPDGQAFASTVSARSGGATIARRAGFIPLDPDGRNAVDCALARLEAEADLPRKIQKAAKPKAGQEVVIVGQPGRTGRIVDVSADLFIDYSFGSFRFVDQVLIEGDKDDFAKDGDSGGIVATNDGLAVALIVAGAGRLTAACPLDKALRSLGVSLVTAPSASPPRHGHKSHSGRKK